MIFPWVYRLLPGPRWFRVLLVVVVAAALVAWLFVWGFDLIAPYLPQIFDGPADDASRT